MANAISANSSAGIHVDDVMIRKLWNKYKEYILYLIFGGLTTLVNYIVYIPLTVVFHVPELIANVIAWIVAVIFAYVTNRIWVFESKSSGIKNIIIEFLKFALGRLVSLGIEEATIGIFVTWLGLNGIVIKVIASIVTIILNYIFGKFLIFKKQPDSEAADPVADQSKEQQDVIR